MDMEKIKVLFVCMGNICRSPTAEGVFAKLLKERKLEEHFVIDSAGTHAYHVGEICIVVPETLILACARKDLFRPTWFMRLTAIKFLDFTL